MKPADPLTEELLGRLLARAGSLCVAVVGDLFLDRYLDLDAGLTEQSLETGLEAYQVVGVRAVPGAAGTVINNLAALGVGCVLPVALVGDDGEGYELRRALDKMGMVEPGGVFELSGRRTPTYTKPMLFEGVRSRELNRLDIKNRSPLTAGDESIVLKGLEIAWGRADAVVVLDQVSEAECGVVTGRVRDAIAAMAEAESHKPVLADSRERIGLFRNVAVKPNARECTHAVFGTTAALGQSPPPARELAARTGRPVYCTLGDKGILLADPFAERDILLPAYPVSGTVDPVGAGDSTSAGIVCALAAGATPAGAAAFGNLVASVTVQQVGTTGTASAEQLRLRLRQVQGR